MSGPFWEPYARAFALKTLGLTLDPPTSPGWGFALVVAGLAYHLAAAKADILGNRQNDQRIRDHDAALMKSFASDFSEPKLSYLFLPLYHDHSIDGEARSLVAQLEDRLRSSDFHLLDKELRESASRLLVELGKLTEFIGTEFFVMYGATSPDRLTLRPDWNNDRTNRDPTPEQMTRYHALGDRLSELVVGAMEAHAALLRLAHERVL